MEYNICSIPRWQELKAQLNNKGYNDFMESYNASANSILLDVRTADEFNEGSIDGARHFDYLVEDLADQLETLDPTKSYYIFCRTGRRSLRVCVLMKNAGFTNVVNLEHGMINKKQ